MPFPGRGHSIGILMSIFDFFQYTFIVRGIEVGIIIVILHLFLKEYFLLEIFGPKRVS